MSCLLHTPSRRYYSAHKMSTLAKVSSSSQVIECDKYDFTLIWLLRRNDDQLALIANIVSSFFHLFDTFPSPYLICTTVLTADTTVPEARRNQTDVQAGTSEGWRG